MPEAAKLGANKSCLGMLKAFGTGDWTTFQSIRIPISGYTTTSAAEKYLLKNSSDANISNVLNAYQATWQKTFKDKPLFSEISLTSNAVTVLELPSDALKTIMFPEFTEVKDRHWFEKSPLSVFDYSRVMTLGAKRVQVLRFFFFGRIDKDSTPYMIVFAWDEEHQTWLPMRLTVALAKQPVHELVWF